MRTRNAILVTATIGLSSLLLGGNVFATDAVTVSPNSTEAKVKVQVPEPRLQDISVYVADAEGRVIYHEDIQAGTTYGKVYDLSNLDEGIYTFTSRGDYITTTKKIMVEGSSAIELSKEVKYKPVISLKNNYLRVNYFNKEQEDIEFSIESSGAIFHESDGGNDIVYGKKLDISKMPPGKYFARLKVGNKDYHHYFERR